MQDAEPAGDAWRERARGFHRRVQERWSRPDSSRAFVLSQVDGDTTVLDIGAGTGSWAVLLAKKARHVTALDSSPGMLEVLRDNAEAEGLDNVAVVQGAWPDAEVAMHDLSFCSHAMYGVADLPHFVRRMMDVTRRRCVLLMRAPLKDSVMAQAALRVWGQPHDSPNFVIAYNVLIQMGIYAHVLMEDTGAWGAWKNASIEEAFTETKAKLGLFGPSEHDAYLRGLLEEHLTYQDGQWVWPPSMRSALVYWDVER
jgi:SAM-dependent methyltransferase